MGLVVLAACGGGGPALPDAGESPPVPDAGPDGAPAACREMAATPRAVPVAITGDVAGGGADLVAPDACAVVDAPFGVESGGVDRVFRITGLVPGGEYGVALAAEADLGFYVVTGCSGVAGPTAGECALFVDATIGGGEHGRFVAAAAEAWLVIDTYDATEPADGAFTAEVYPIECADAAACAGTAPVCLDGRCVACADSFDCATAAAPWCDPVTDACRGGDAGCVGEDPGEPGDDGPAGARLLAVDAGGAGALAGTICDTPARERDHVAFDVATAGETWRFELGWATTDDLDLVAYDATGDRLGLSYHERPEVIELTYLAPGRYVLAIDDFAGGGAVAYTLGAQRTTGPGCASSADCAAEYRNQIYRGACVAGACVSIDRAGAAGAGEACDSSSDCAPALHCPSFYFVADADTRATCNPGCTGDADCASLGPDHVCTTYLADNFCVPKCTEPDHCPTIPGVTPAVPPWKRLACQAATGRCL